MKYCLTITVLVLFAGLIRGQDPIYSQFYASPVLINPAFAGNTFGPNLTLNYRNQYPSWQPAKAYETVAATFDQYFEDLNSGIGLAVLSDNAGDGILKSTRLSAIYAYRLQVWEDFFVKLGIEGSYVQKRLDWEQLIFLDQIDPEIGPISPGGTPFPSAEIPPDNLSISYADISAGMLLYSRSLYGGFSLKHMNTPEESFLNIGNNLNGGLPMRLTLQAGGQIEFFSGRSREPVAFISPNILYVRQGAFGQVNVGAYAGIGMFFTGLWYRNTFNNPDAAILLVGVRKDFLKIGYTYDMTVSGLAGETGGSHEVSIGFSFNRPRPQDINDCLKMFR